MEVILPLHLLRILLILAVFPCINGCGVGNWFILTSSDRFTADPAQVGVPYRQFSVPSDGLRLNGWYVAGAPTKPLIVIFHGNAGNISDCVDYIKLLHGSGFSVCLFDYRGYGASSGESFGEEDLYQDARAVLAYVKSCGWRSDNIIYYGQSMGAGVALQMAIEDPPAGIVLESPFTSFDAVATFHAPVSYQLLGKLMIDIRFENIAKISRISSPLLIIHGDNDEVVPVDMSLQLFARARSEKQLYLIRGGGHCDGFSVDKEAVTMVIRQFVSAAAG